MYPAVRTVTQRLERDVAARGVVLDNVDWKEFYSEESLEQRLADQVLEPKRNCTDHIAVVPSDVVAVAAGQPGLVLGVDASNSVTKSFASWQEAPDPTKISLLRLTDIKPRATSASL